MHLKSPKQQGGAVLVIALVFLLILTTLAVTNMREVALDSRITANLVDQRNIFNAAEAGLTDGQYRTIGPEPNMTRGNYDRDVWQRPLNATDACSNGVTDVCLLDIAPGDVTYSQDFDTVGKFKDYAPDDSTTFNESISWYALPVPAGETEGASINPEYGNMLSGSGEFYYEVNSRAENDGEVRLRNTIFRIYN